MKRKKHLAVAWGAQLRHPTLTHADRINLTVDAYGLGAELLHDDRYRETAQNLGALAGSIDRITQLRPANRLAIARLAVDETIASYALLRFGRSEGVSTSTTDAGPLMGTAIDGDSVRVYLRRSHVLTSSKNLYMQATKTAVH